MVNSILVEGMVGVEVGVGGGTGRGVGLLLGMGTPGDGRCCAYFRSMTTRYSIWNTQFHC